MVVKTWVQIPVATSSTCRKQKKNLCTEFQEIEISSVPCIHIEIILGLFLARQGRLKDHHPNLGQPENRSSEHSKTIIK